MRGRPRALRGPALALVCAVALTAMFASAANAAITDHQLIVDRTGLSSYINVDVGPRYAVMQKQGAGADVVAYDLTAASPVEIAVAAGSADEKDPTVWGDTCAYLRRRELGTHELVVDTIPPSSPTGQIITYWDYADPSLWGDTCVYALDDDGDGDYGVYSWTIGDNYHYPVYVSGTDKTTARNPEIWRGIVAVQIGSTIGGHTDVWYKSLEGGYGVAPYMPGYTGDRVLPGVWGEWVVWEDHTSADHDVIAYNVLTRKGTVLGHDGAIDGNPSVFDDRVVYTSIANDLSSASVYAYDLMTGAERTLWSRPGVLVFGQTSMCGTDAGWYDFVTDADAHVARMTVSLETEQLQGPTRYDTAVEISEACSPGTCDSVIVATGANFPDALGGSALAGALDCPILLTRPNDLPTVVRNEIARLLPKTVYILGGTGAVSSSVQTEIESVAPGCTVRRLEGADRYGTARAVAYEGSMHPRQEFGGEAIVATGANFPDALAVSPVAAALQMPIYLAEPAGISQPSISQMQERGITEVYMIGGADVVSAETEERLTDAFGTDHVHRIAGPTRYDTAAEIAEWAVEEMPWIEYCGVTIATGQNFPDALAGGALAGSRGTVMLLTHSTYLTPSTQDVLATECNDAPRVTFFGGAGAIEPAVIESVKDVVD